jgi:demethylmenaquinone methyltransferase/2-methoxy-6-polyprenyl-1,4-benzoquinol methylase
LSAAPPLPTGTDRPHRPLTEFYATPEQRPGYVANLFNRSAEHYDWISSVLSFGSDRYYRRRTLARAGVRPGLRMLDVATGTGLVARAALECGVARHDLAGLDPSEGMLAENRRTTGIPLFRGFGEALPFRDESFDFISMGYALRHVESLELLFREFRRVLKPGGSVLLLEISRPASSAGTAVLRAFMNGVIPVVARWRARQPELPELMRYYWATIEHCVPPEHIVEALRASGFGEVERRRTGPVLNDYFARK